MKWTNKGMVRVNTGVLNEINVAQFIEVQINSKSCPSKFPVWNIRQRYLLLRNIEIYSLRVYIAPRHRIPNFENSLPNVLPFSYKRSSHQRTYCPWSVPEWGHHFTRCNLCLSALTSPVKRNISGEIFAEFVLSKAVPWFLTVKKKIFPEKTAMDTEHSHA